MKDLNKIQSCPECLLQGRLFNLKLHQINLTEAVYLCEYEKCSYPDGHTPRIVNRTLNEMMIVKRKKASKKNEDTECDLDQWLQNVYTNISGVDPELVESLTLNQKTNEDIGIDSSLQDFSKIDGNLINEKSQKTDDIDEFIHGLVFEPNLSPVKEIMENIEEGFNTYEIITASDNTSSSINKIQDNENTKEHGSNHLVEMLNSDTIFGVQPSIKTYYNKRKQNNKKPVENLSTRDLLSDALNIIPGDKSVADDDLPKNAVSLDKVYEFVDRLLENPSSEDESQTDFRSVNENLDISKEINASINTSDTSGLVFNDKSIKVTVFNGIDELPPEYKKILFSKNKSRNKFTPVSANGFTNALARSLRIPKVDHGIDKL